MSYCIKCGVELGSSEQKCPLCGTVVYHPDIKREDGKKPYPPYKSGSEETINLSGVLFVVTVVWLIPILLTLMADFQINGKLKWAGYAVGALVLLYTIIVLPIWFKAPNPVIFSSADFAAVALYLFYINFETNGSWFLTFALPVVSGSAIIVVTVITLMRYVRRGYLFMFGGAFIVNGFFGVLIETLLNLTFHIRDTLVWSIYPLIAFFLIGASLIVIAICKPLRESLHKKFFI